MELQLSSRERLAASACRRADTLRAFVQARISPNAWPIHCRSLVRRIESRGLDLTAARQITLTFDQLAGLMGRMLAALLRVERALKTDNAFHHRLHNLEVLLRLLQLEWPVDRPLPERLRCSAFQPYTSRAGIEPVLHELLRELLALGVPSWLLARDLLAAVGHDYGHIGGTDRLDASGARTPLTHEETSERHVAKFGLETGMPAALVLESMAGIRATTFHIRSGREPIEAANDFERKLMLADVAGCVLPADRWLTHVAMPVLHEKIESWKRHAEVAPSSDQGIVPDQGIARHVGEFFVTELRFLRFIKSARLEAVPSARRLWGESIDGKIALIERVLERRDLLAPLEEGGIELITALAGELANADSLEGWLAGDDRDANVRAVFSEFLGAAGRGGGS